MTENEKYEYILKYEEHEGIKLDKANIAYNNCPRQTAKLLLNSHWGKYAMQTNKIQQKLIDNVNEWFEFLCDKRHIVHSVDMSRPNSIQVYYTIEKEMHHGSNTTNVIIAAFVTAQARLKLYSVLEKLNERVLTRIRLFL